MRDAIAQAAMMVAEKRLRDRADEKIASVRQGRPIRRLTLVVGDDNKPLFETAKDKKGRAYRVYRGSSINPHPSQYTGAALRQIRAENGVGRPVIMLGLSGNKTLTSLALAAEALRANATPHPFRAAVEQHGSQRKAAKALGLSLGSLQRRLAKEAA